MLEGLGAGSSGQGHPHIKLISISTLKGLNLAKSRHTLTGNSSLLLVSGANSQTNPSGVYKSPLAMAFQQHPPLLPQQVPNPSTKLLPALPAANWELGGLQANQIPRGQRALQQFSEQGMPQCPAVTHQEQEVGREQFHLQLHRMI